MPEITKNSLKSKFALAQVSHSKKTKEVTLTFPDSILEVLSPTEDNEMYFTVIDGTLQVSGERPYSVISGLPENFLNKFKTQVS